ncbi:MAG TPA: prolyl oligopeptidase family serine peptidase, partial [Steroidobacteraceae bacterium]|nr:prolyl oligopeptidase family serine peptidase [Steroidobacteraceae bacterium]
DDPQNILIAEYDGRVRGLRWYLDADAPTEIALLDVYTGEKRSLGVVPLNGARVLVDGDEQVRFAVGLDVRRRLAVVWKPQAYSSWVAFEVKGFRKGSVLPRLFSADGRSVYFTGVAEGQSVSSLFRFDLESHTVEQIYSFGNVDVDGLVTDVTGREIVGLTAYANRAVYHWLATDHPSAKLYAAFQRAFPDQEIAVTSTTSDGRLSVVFVSSDVNPGEYHLFDRVTGSIQFMRAIRPWMDSGSMRPKQPIQLTARDGMKLHGYVTRPPSGGRHPLIVLPHGGPDGTRDRWNFDWVVQLFASRGYAVLQVNFRGSGGYGMDFEAAGFRQWGGAIQDDITDATRWAIDQGIADADRICIFGSGFGGHAALMGVVREPDLYRCAVGYSGIYDLRLLSEEAPRFGSRRSYLETVRSEDPADTRNRSPVHHAARITVPVLLIHGEDDWSADFDHSKRLRRAMERHEKSVEWISFGREGHGIYDENTRRDVYERILAFLERNLTPSAAVAEQGQSEAR